MPSFSGLKNILEPKKRSRDLNFFFLSLIIWNLPTLQYQQSGLPCTISILFINSCESPTIKCTKAGGCKICISWNSRNSSHVIVITPCVGEWYHPAIYTVKDTTVSHASGLHSYPHSSFVIITKWHVVSYLLTATNFKTNWFWQWDYSCSQTLSIFGQRVRDFNL